MHCIIISWWFNNEQDYCQTSCSQAFTLFATHFLELCQLETLYPNVENQHMEVQHSRVEAGAETVLFTHVLCRGRSEERQYGAGSWAWHCSPLWSPVVEPLFCGICSARFESSRADCPAIKHYQRCKGHFLQGQPAAFGRLPVASWCTHTMKIVCMTYLYFIICIRYALCAWNESYNFS